MQSKYIDWIPRVSDIVSFKYPFEWNAKERYLKWLNINGIPEWEYLFEAQIIWTFVHAQIERGKPEKDNPLFLLHKNEILFWLEKLKELKKLGKVHKEMYILDYKKRYQWTIDLVIINEKKKVVYIYDWKTWWIAKKKWWLKNEYKKPYDKIKKVALQLSLYAEYFRRLWYNIEAIAVEWLHNTWCYEYELDLYTSREINKIIKEYENKKN